MAPQCAGEAQSAIDIAEYTLESNRWEDNLMINFDKEGGLITGTLVNNGKAPTLEVDKTGRSAARLTGGPVGDGVYMLEQFHFHFGCASKIGSEHLSDGHSFPVEVFIIGYLQDRVT